MTVTSIVEVRDHKINNIGESLSLENSKKLDKDEALVQMFYGNSVGTHPGGKLYKKDILLKYGCIIFLFLQKYKNSIDKKQIVNSFCYLCKVLNSEIYKL